MSLCRSQKRRRNKLFIKHPFCHWCGCKLVKSTQDSPNAVTLDHVYGRLDSRRSDPNYDNKTVLACKLCNSKRGRLDELRALKTKNSP